MSHSLSRWQAVVLGLVVVAAVGLGGLGLARIAERQGLWGDTFEVVAGFPEVHDVSPGTPVRIRGVDAGQVVAVEYPDHDGPGAEVTVRMRLNGRFARRVYADATAKIHTPGLLGAKVVSVEPGSPASGPLAGGRLKGVPPFDVGEAVAEVKGLAAEARGLLKDVRESNGTVMKLVRDDDLYADLKGTVARADKAIAALEGEVSGVRGFVQDGRETLRSVKQGTDALGKMPLVRNYVENPSALLVRPNHRREMWPFAAADLFEPGTATLSYSGQVHMNNMANVIKETAARNAEVVAAAFWDPADKSQTPASASELTRKQAEAVVNHLKQCDVHKLGYFSRRKLTPLGMGSGTSPVVEKGPLPPCVVQVMVFTP